MEQATLRLIVGEIPHTLTVPAGESLINVNGHDILVELKGKSLRVHESASSSSQSIVMNAKGIVELERSQCKQCGSLYYEHYSDCRELTLMRGKHICFGCAFWHNMVEKHGNDPLWWRVNGRSYIPKKTLLPDEKAVSQRHGGPFKGFAGREFFVKINDGAIHRTDDLWGQGTIPDWLSGQFPDNAEFIGREEYWALQHGNI